MYLVCIYGQKGTVCGFQDAEAAFRIRASVVALAGHGLREKQPTREFFPPLLGIVHLPVFRIGSGL